MIRTNRRIEYEAEWNDLAGKRTIIGRNLIPERVWGRERKIN